MTETSSGGSDPDPGGRWEAVAGRSGRAWLLAAGFVALLPLAGARAGAEADDFADPQAVTIAGYTGDALEPFVTCDDRFLLFNDGYDAAGGSDLHWAERTGPTSFEYRGELAGANSAALDAVPSVACDGTLVFVSTRDYAATLASLFRARFDEGVVTEVEPLDGLSLEQPGWVNFDVEISPDGSRLYFVDGLVDATPPPEAADLALANATLTGFERSAQGPALLAQVNSGALEYAAAISADGLELFLTRFADDTTAILRATRTSLVEPFSPPQPLAAVTGFVEAPALGPDGLALYYHRGESGAFSIYRATRAGRFAIFRDGFESGTTAAWSESPGGS